MELNEGGWAKAGTSKSNKTGSWKTFRPVVSEKCTGCGLCSQFCPDQAISIVEGKAKVDLDFCKGCGICSQVCPQKAIRMER